jgi:hypothetical protein
MSDLFGSQDILYPQNFGLLGQKASFSTRTPNFTNTRVGRWFGRPFSAGGRTVTQDIAAPLQNLTREYNG